MMTVVPMNLPPHATTRSWRRGVNVLLDERHRNRLEPVRLRRAARRGRSRATARNAVGAPVSAPTGAFSYPRSVRSMRWRPPVERIKRPKRNEGQVRRVQGMVEDERYCARIMVRTG
ncbi:MAG: metal-sensing transcriptional repressor [Candidatus Binataceae bacterium]